MLCPLPQDARSSELTEFIVDSGSDVVTATESLIQSLQLEYLRNVDSRGPYSTANKPLYRGILKLGTEEFEVEVGDEPDKKVLFFFSVSTLSQYWVERCYFLTNVGHGIFKLTDLRQLNLPH